MKFIIFDLDDTLLSGDCEREWINFLFLKGLIKDPKSKLDEFDQSYRKGALDFEEYSIGWPFFVVKSLNPTTL